MRSLTEKLTRRGGTRLASLLVTALMVLVAAPAVAAGPSVSGPTFERTGDGQMVASDRLVVSFHDVSVTDAMLREAAPQATIARFDRSAWVILPQPSDLAETAARLRTIPGVATVRRDAMVSATGLPPGLSKLCDLWFFKLILGKLCAAEPPGPEDWHRDAIRLDAALDLQPTAAPIVVAILDTGLSTDAQGQPLAPAVADGAAVLPGYDLVNLDEDPADDNGHGTLMASILSATAPGVTIVPIKVLDANRQGTEATLAAGIDLAVDMGADVISMSLAFPEGFIPSSGLVDAVARADAQGVVLVAASGNHGSGEVAYPAAFGPVISVGAATLTKPLPAGMPDWLAPWRTGWASYSGWGVPLDVSAPGGDLTLDLDYNDIPDGVQGQTFLPGDPNTYLDVVVAGTSAATAQAAGAAALLLAVGADATGVRPALQDGATDRPPAEFDTLTGAGVIDVYGAIQSVLRADVPALPKRYVNSVMTLVEKDGQRRAVALVEVVDEDMQPVEGVSVLGHFRGDVRHDVAGTTDADGVVLVASLPADAGALFEFGVDKIFEPYETETVGWGKKKTTIDKAQHTVAIVPQTFARFEHRSLVTLASFASVSVEGAGLGKSPFIIGIDNLALLPVIDARADTTTRAPDPPPSELTTPIETVVPDLETWAPIPTMMARTYARTSVSASTTFAFDRTLLDDCQLAAQTTPVQASGAGLGKSPFILDDTMLDGGATGDDVIVVGGDGTQAHLLFNGEPTTAEDIGILLGTPGIVLVGATGTGCAPSTRLVTDVGVFPDDTVSGQTAGSGGFVLDVVAVEGSPDFEPWLAVWQSLVDAATPAGGPATDDTMLGAGWGGEIFATGSNAMIMTSTDISTPIATP